MTLKKHIKFHKESEGPRSVNLAKCWEPRFKSIQIDLEILYCSWFSTKKLETCNLKFMMNYDLFDTDCGI